jgi:DNA-binding NarL/FixJ family response regulator
MLAGQAFAQDGQRGRATAELTKAADVFQSSGALRYRDRAEQQLRQLGQHIHRRTRAGKSDGVGVELLTERQLQIALLVVARRTNPQIAAELFLSQKTIESHMHNMFHKVGVSSRVELARAIERADRTTRSAPQ